MASNRIKKLATETSWFAIGSFGSKVLSFLLVPLYTSILTTYEYGQIDILLTTINLALPILGLSAWDAVFRFAMDKDENKSLILSSGLFIIVASVFFLPLIYPLIKYTLNGLEEYWIYFMVLYTVNGILDTLMYFLRATDKTKICAIQGIIYTFVFSIFNVLLLVIFDLSIVGYFISQIFAGIMGILYMLYAGNCFEYITIKNIKFGIIRKMITYSMPLIPASVAWWIIASIDRYMLLYMCGEDANGLYAVANKIPTILTFFTSFFINAWQIAAVRTKDDYDSSEFTSKIYSGLFIVCLIFAFPLILTSDLLANILFSNEFIFSWTMIPALLVGTVFSTCSLFVGAQFTAYKRSDLHFYSNFYAMIGNIAFNYLFISYFGRDGASFGTMVSFFLVLLYRHRKVKELMNFEYNKGVFLIISTFMIVSSFIASINMPYWKIYVGVMFIVSVALSFKMDKSLYLYIYGLIKNKGKV